MIKNFFSKRHLFRFSILGSWHSTLSAYGLVALLFFLLPLLGTEPREIKAGYLLIVLINTSIVILTCNAIYQRAQKPLSLWLLINFPLWCFIPLQFKILLNGIKCLFDTGLQAINIEILTIIYNTTLFYK